MRPGGHVVGESDQTFAWPREAGERVRGQPQMPFQAHELLCRDADDNQRLELRAALDRPSGRCQRRVRNAEGLLAGADAARSVKRPPDSCTQ